MTSRKKLVVLEKSIHRPNYVPPIVIHIILEPTEDGPKDVEAFFQMQTNGICQRVECIADETQEQFESRIYYYFNFAKTNFLQKS